MKPSKGLRRDPAKTRGWQQRSRKPLGQDPEKGLKRSAPMRQESAKHRAKKKAQRAAEGPLSPREWRVAGAVAAGLRCMVTRTRARHAFDPRFQVHHPLPKGVLRDRGHFDRVWDPRNTMFVLTTLHRAHEGVGAYRLPRSAVPAAVWEFCAELDAREGTEWATERVKRAHPAQPGGGVQPQMNEGEPGG